MGALAHPSTTVVHMHIPCPGGRTPNTEKAKARAARLRQRRRQRLTATAAAAAKRRRQLRGNQRRQLHGHQRRRSCSGVKSCGDGCGDGGGGETVAASLARSRRILRTNRETAKRAPGETGRRRRGCSGLTLLFMPDARGHRASVDAWRGRCADARHLGQHEHELQGAGVELAVVEESQAP